MTTPAATARTTPSGKPLRDGYQTLITFARFPSVSFWEKTVTPFDVTTDDPIDQTTMWNQDVETAWPQALAKIGKTQATVAYDPGVLSTILQMVNVNDTVSITHPDGSTDAFFGTLTKFTRKEVKRGEQPMADIEIAATNLDGTYAEQKPVTTSVSGT